MLLGVLAHIAFWVLLPIAAFEMGWRSAVLAAAFWAIGYVASSWLVLTGPFLFTSYVAVLDVILILLVFGRDIAFR